MGGCTRVVTRRLFHVRTHASYSARIIIMHHGITHEGTIGCRIEVDGAMGSSVGVWVRGILDLFQVWVVRFCRPLHGQSSIGDVRQEPGDLTEVDPFVPIPPRNRHEFDRWECRRTANSRILAKITGIRTMINFGSPILANIIAIQIRKGFRSCGKGNHMRLNRRLRGRRRFVPNV